MRLDCNCRQHLALSRRGFGQGVLAATLPLACPATIATDIVDPRMHLFVPPGAPRTVALTLDACGGGVDMRILQTLLDLRVAATIFVTHPWLQANPTALAQMRARHDLFSLQNHGERHLPPVLGNRRVYGLTVAGTLDGIRREVEAGAAAVVATGAPGPTWYRGAAALYSEAAIPAIEAVGFRVGAYSFSADEGASLPAAAVAARVAAAASGDIIIGHINQPHRSSGAGIAEGVTALHREGVVFSLLGALPVSPLMCHRAGHSDLLV
jgi:peptidoglycan/xylan/chitin deacetylase (PgdA/CDA1 family)